MESDDHRYVGRIGRACLTLSVVAGSLAAVGPGERVMVSGEPRQAESNELSVFVDGRLGKSWTVAELMKGRFDWVSPKENFYPVVPVAFVLELEKHEIQVNQIVSIRFRGQRGSFVLTHPSVEDVEGLLVKLDLERGGSWQLVARDAATRRRIENHAGTPIQLRRLRTIELTHESPSGD